MASSRPKSQLEILAVERQIADLDHGHKRGLVWREDEARRAISLFEHLKHWKAEFHGQAFRLSGWQEHLVIAPLFGWWRDDGLRRFRVGYIELPRKNGKTALLAGIGLQGLVADREPGAEVYSAATGGRVSERLFEDASKFASSSPMIRDELEFYQRSLRCARLSSRFEPLPADASRLHGLNIHRALVDEVHEHKTRYLWDVLLTATASRRNPLQLGITTAGHDRSSICWELRELTRKILEGAIEDDSQFGLITCAEPGDDILSPDTWAKANPNLGISVKLDYLKTRAARAASSPSEENTFRRLHLNQWTEQSVRWLPMDAWDRCQVA